MFVFNCTVNFEETLKIPEGVDKKELKKTKWKSRKRKQEQADSEVASGSAPSSEKPDESESSIVGDDFHPVTCTACGTRVAVYDKDEIYHFFHVLASH